MLEGLSPGNPFSDVFFFPHLQKIAVSTGHDNRNNEDLVTSRDLTLGGTQVEQLTD